jgi:hypothetical protein
VSDHGHHHDHVHHDHDHEISHENVRDLHHHVSDHDLLESKNSIRKNVTLV